MSRATLKGKRKWNGELYTRAGCTNYNYNYNFCLALKKSALYAYGEYVNRYKVLVKDWTNMKKVRSFLSILDRME